MYSWVKGIVWEEILEGTKGNNNHGSFFLCQVLRVENYRNKKATLLRREIRESIRKFEPFTHQPKQNKLMRNRAWQCQVGQYSIKRKAGTEIDGFGGCYCFSSNCRTKKQ